MLENTDNNFIMANQLNCPWQWIPLFSELVAIYFVQFRAASMDYAKTIKYQAMRLFHVCSCDLREWGEKTNFERQSIEIA